MNSFSEAVFPEIFLRHIDEKFPADKISSNQHRVRHGRAIPQGQFDIVKFIK